MQFCFMCVGWTARFGEEFWCHHMDTPLEVGCPHAWTKVSIPFSQFCRGCLQGYWYFRSSAKGRQALCGSLDTYPSASGTKYCASGLICPVLAACWHESATILCLMLSGDGAMRLFQTKISLQTITWAMGTVRGVLGPIRAQDTMGQFQCSPGYLDCLYLCTQKRFYSGLFG